MTNKTSKMTPSDELAVLCAQVAYEKKAEEIVIMDLAELSVITDYFVICSVKSRPQMKALLNILEKTLEENGRHKIGVEGLSTNSWLLCDFGDVIVHVFTPEAREYYDLEILWGDAPKVEWEPLSRITDK